MASQIMFFRKNKLDLDFKDVSIEVIDNVATENGQLFTGFMRNRNNRSAWLTTGSTDAAETTLIAHMVDIRRITDLLLVGHNLKSFKAEYWTGFVWADLPTPVNVVDEAQDTSHFYFGEVYTNKIKLTIYGTQVPDTDKKIKQWIITERLGVGQLEGWPIVKKPTTSFSRRTSEMLSGRVNVVESVGRFSCSLAVNSWKSDADLTIVEELYLNRQGFLVWLSGGDEEQFWSRRVGFRREDIYYMKPTNEYSPEFRDGVYTNGVKIDIDLVEAV